MPTPLFMFPDYDRAMEDYNRAISLDLDFAMAYVNRGNLYAEMWPPEYAKALKDFNHAIKLDDKDAMAYNNRGILYTKVQPPDSQ